MFVRPDEMRDAGALAGTTLGEITDVVRDVHRAVAARVFGLAGAPGEPVKLMHDGIAAIAYGSTRAGVRGLPTLAGLVASLARRDTTSVHDSPRGRFVLGAVNGFLGDSIADERASLAPLMRVRLHDGPLRHIAANVAHDARDTATARLVLFAHGLCETDLCWWYAAEKRWGDRNTTYGSKLSEDGWTPLYLNFNTGRHISENGRELDSMIEALVAAWPVPVAEIAIVGHSLGGLVARSAAHQAHADNHEWVRKLTHIVGLGTPHTGAPLERFANWGTHQLNRLPETRTIARFLNRRSVGIKDLRYGAFLDVDWTGHDLDELLTDHCQDAEFVPGVLYSVASATLSREPDGIFAHDLLVQHSSAHGRGKVRSIPFDPARGFHIGGRKTHFDLLADPQVYAQLRQWLAVAPPVRSKSARGRWIA